MTPILYDWPLEPRRYFQLPTIKRITLFEDHRIVLPILWSQNWTEEVGTNITWGPETTIHSAKIEISADPGAFKGLNFVFKMNRAEILKITDWGAGGQRVIDVTGRLPKGHNTFQAGIWASPPVYFETSLIFTAILAIEYSGEDPWVTPPTPETRWEDIAMYLGIGALFVGGAYVIVKGLKKG